MKTFTGFAACLLIASTAPASTVTVSDFRGSGATFQESVVLRSTGNRLPNGGGLVRIGYFENFQPEDFSFRVALNREPPVAYSYISEHFVPLGEALPAGFGTPSPAVPPGFYFRTVNGIPNSGRLFGSVTGVVPTADPPNSFGNLDGVPGGSRLFLVIYDATSPELATEFGVFSATNWLMPANSLLNVSLNTVDVDMQGEVFRGSWDFSGLTLQAVIPEPGTASLLMVSGLLRRRRR